MSNPNTSLNKPSNRSDDIDKEVHLLMKKNTNKQKSTYTILEELKTKYKDEEIVDSIMRKYNEKMKKVRKLAEKIKERLVAKYPNLTMKEYIEKITEYKKKYNFDDSEMQSIINLIFLNKSTISNTEALDVNYNEMSKALGFVPASFNLSGKLHVKKDELDQFQMILTIASATKELHNQVTLQSLIYKDCDKVAIQQSFDKTKINIFSFVHPVVAALFIPKIELLDQHMLLASIAEIVAYKANGQELQTQPEYELYWDIATDPAETACVNKTKPFTDLVNRCNVQTKLWEAVLNLRQGKYYTNDLNSFIMAIDNCRSSVFDAADLAYVKDEGTIMRKLLAAFSIRPTIVLTMPVYGITPLTSHISSVSSSHITTLPMITMRIPMTFSQEPESIHLNNALSQEQLYIHHRQLTVKQQQILYSREILVFYVHRRYQTINTEKLTNPYRVTTLPFTMNQFEKLQQVEIGVDMDNLVIGGSNSNSNGGQNFSLKSVVLVETKKVVNQSSNNEGPEIIISCSALIRADFVSDPLSNSVAMGYKYNPLKLDSNGLYVNALDYYTDVAFMEEARTRGTLFIYTSSDKPSELVTQNY
jgi:hypothetical protein